jgi:hypothetical protein
MMTFTVRLEPMPDEAESSNPEFSQSLVLAFAPLHKRALGIAVGTAFGLAIAVITIIFIAAGRPNAINLGLLSQYFWGYTPTWLGVVVGFWWGFLAGFVTGWFLAFCRNAAIAVSIFLVRTRSQLGNTRDFLDHI